MRRLTHRTRLSLREERKALNREKSFRRVTKGPGVHLSSRSVWRGFWWAQGAICKWSRADQILMGMRWNHYMCSGKATPLFNHHDIPGMPPLASGLLGGGERAEAFLSRHGVEQEAESFDTGRITHHAHGPATGISVRAYPAILDSAPGHPGTGFLGGGAHHEDGMPAAMGPPAIQNASLQTMALATPVETTTPMALTANAIDFVVEMGGSCDGRRPEAVPVPAPIPMITPSQFAQLLTSFAAFWQGLEPAEGSDGFAAASANPPETKSLPSIETYGTPPVAAIPDFVGKVAAGTTGIWRRFFGGRTPSAASCTGPETGNGGLKPGALGPETGGWRHETTSAKGFGYIGSWQRRVMQLKVARADAEPPQ